MLKKENEIKSRIRSLLWDFIYNNKWKDLDDFSLRLADRLFESMKQSTISIQNVQDLLRKTRTNFFVVNKVSKRDFAQKLFAELRIYFHDIIAEASVPLSTVDLFPEMSSVSEEEVEQKLGSLDVEEKYLQDCLRKILRKKKASPVPDRKRDTAQEVADVEQFRMKTKGYAMNLVAVVKGYRSISAKTLTWEDVSHQITKAYQRTRPDYIILISAKDPADGLISSLNEYATTVGNPNLVIFVPPRDLTRLLIAYNFL
jgi:hypothetical protein